jgi:uncharacterized membrane protein HdeD (DUF308 family)
MAMKRPEPHKRAFWKSARREWQRMLIEGIVLVILGWLALALPIFAAAMLFNTVIGWLFVVSGLIGLVATLGGRHTAGFWWSLLSAVLAIAVGSTLMQWPAANSVPIAYVLTTFFVIEGLATIMFALDHRRRLSGRWEWMVASGLIDLSLAVLVIVGLPDTLPWTIGLLVGINMIFGGSALIVMAIYAHTTSATPS